MSVSMAFPVGPKPRLEVRLPSGRLDVELGDYDAIRIESADSAADQLEIESTGDTVYVRFPERRREYRSVRLTVAAPRGTELDVAGASLDVGWRGALGVVAVKLASGDIRGDDAGSIEAKTASGSVLVGRVDGRVAVTTASGDIRVGDAGGDLSVTTASGDCRVETAAGNVRWVTASGDLLVERFLGSELTSKAVSGDVRVGFPTGVRLDADVNSFTGSVRFPPPRSDSGPSTRVVRFSAKAVSGDVDVFRADG